MKRLMNSVFGAAAMIAACVVSTAPASAQSWPTQRVTVVVPFGAGSVTDILARIFAEEMGRRWDQQVIVENRPGLAGTAAVAKAAPDGYTLMVTSNGHTVCGPGDQGCAVRSGEGFRRHHAARLGAAVPDHPSGHAGQDAEGGHRTRQEGAGQAQLLLAGLASTTFIAGALFRKVAGINIVHVPFRSAPDAVTAVIRGDAQMYFAPVNLARDQSEAGKVKAIAAATATAHPGHAERADLHRGGTAVRL